MTWIASHLSGRYAYDFDGTEYVRIPDNTSLDTPNDLSIGWMQTQARLDCGIWSKGDPTGGAAGFSWFIESINGFFRIVLSDGIETIAWDTDNPVGNTSLKKVFFFVWNGTTGEMLFYIDGNPEPLSINAGAGSISDSGLFGGINVTNTDIEFGRVIGRPLFVGEMHPAIMRNSVASPQEVDTFFQSIEDGTQVEPTRDIVISSDQNGTYNMYLMKETGSDRKIVENSVYHDYRPRFSRDGGTIYFTSTQDGNNVGITDGSNNRPLDADNTITSNILSDSIERTARFINVDGSGRSVSIYDTESHEVMSSASGDYVWVVSETTDSSDIFYMYSFNIDPTTKVISNRDLSTITSYGSKIRYPDSDPLNENKWITINSNSIYEYTDNDSSEATQGVLLHSSSEHIIETRYSTDGLKIGFSQFDGTNYQVWVMDRNGSNASQVTSSTGDKYFCGFSPDTTQIIYSSNQNGTNWQIYKSDIDGSNAHNISNNNFNDIYADWRA